MMNMYMIMFYDNLACLVVSYAMVRWNARGEGMYP